MDDQEILTLVILFPRTAVDEKVLKLHVKMIEAVRNANYSFHSKVLSYCYFSFFLTDGIIEIY